MTHTVSDITVDSSNELKRNIKIFPVSLNVRRASCIMSTERMQHYPDLLLKVRL